VSENMEGSGEGRDGEGARVEEAGVDIGVALATIRLTDAFQGQVGEDCD
jgi:hypothetical protein